MVGGNYLLEDVRCTAKQGRIIVVGLLAGKKASLDLGQLLSKRLTITGTTLRSRPLEDKIYAMRVFSRSIVPLILAGKVRPVIDKVFKLEEAGLAHEYLESNESFGKVVLSV
jgi:NADPH2:quinone reductase